MTKFVDPYLDPETGILRNLAAAKTYEALYQAEADSAMYGELEARDIPRTNNLEELCAIHKALFGAVYDWAGEIRTVDIRKNEANSDFFLIVSRIPTGCEYVFNELKQNNYLQNLNRVDFITKLAYFYDQLNYIHPFREGNGRTQRIFWSRVAKDAGYQIDWSKTTREENDAASKLAAESQNLSLLNELIQKILLP